MGEKLCPGLPPLRRGAGHELIAPRIRKIAMKCSALPSASLTEVTMERRQFLQQTSLGAAAVALAAAPSIACCRCLGPHREGDPYDRPEEALQPPDHGQFRARSGRPSGRPDDRRARLRDRRTQT